MIKFIYMQKKQNETKYQLLINKRERTGLKYLNDSKVFIEYSNDMDDVYKNIEECFSDFIPSSVHKILNLQEIKNITYMYIKRLKNSWGNIYIKT